ncbi:MAG: 4Fe-4S ferredoxin [Thermoprotei archaeon]|nr:MAG: 4Fe-4S ferredoxin [Thermoprotei archaeon]
MSSSQKPKFIKIYVMGRAYEVPEGLTIMKALEYAGFRLIRGVGCRGGFCGACPTVYRLPGDYKLRIGLACQTIVQDGMHLVILPFVPMEKPRYNIDELKPDAGLILSLFPEVSRCVSCNTCTKACPQGLDVMDAVQAILRGDIAKAANTIFDCISCGICSMRCPAEIRHIHLFQLIRRLYGKYILPKAKHVEERLKEIESGKYEEELNKLMVTPIEKLKKLYSERKIET